jgi:hypothetical protein
MASRAALRPPLPRGSPSRWPRHYSPSAPQHFLDKSNLRLPLLPLVLRIWSVLSRKEQRAASPAYQARSGRASVGILSRGGDAPSRGAEAEWAFSIRRPPSSGAGRSRGRGGGGGRRGASASRGLGSTSPAMKKGRASSVQARTRRKCLYERNTVSSQGIPSHMKCI